MADLANIIKNINPPIELTQLQYNSLSTQQKNNGAIYYVTDGNGNKQTAATTSALNLQGKNSNIQKQLDNLNTSVSNIISGEVSAYSAKQLIAPYSMGITTDSYGNFKHKRDTTSDYWSVQAYEHNTNGNIGYPLIVNFQTGAINRRVNGSNKRICYGIGDTYQTSYRGTGYLVSSSKKLRVFIPILTCGTVATVTDIKLTACHFGGGYIYMKYTGGSPVALSNNLKIWENGEQVYSKSISSIETVVRDLGIDISINFTNTLVTSNASNAANVTNATAVGLYITPTIVFSE